MRLRSWTMNDYPLLWRFVAQDPFRLPPSPRDGGPSGSVMHRDNNGSDMADVLTASQNTTTLPKAASSLRTLSLVSLAHWVSHFHMLVLPMLFPFLKAQLGVGYVELGFSMTVFAVVSAVIQTPVGYVVDHLGARRVLIGGLTLGGLSLVMLGLHLSYTSLVTSAVLLGVADAVYHP